MHIDLFRTNRTDVENFTFNRIPNGFWLLDTHNLCSKWAIWKYKILLWRRIRRKYSGIFVRQCIISCLSLFSNHRKFSFCLRHECYCSSANTYSYSRIYRRLHFNKQDQNKNFLNWNFIISKLFMAQFLFYRTDKVCNVSECASFSILLQWQTWFRIITSDFRKGIDW